MALVDYASYNNNGMVQGLAGLGQTIQNAPIHDLAKLKLEEARRQSQDNSDLRSTLADLQPNTITTTTPGKAATFTPEQVRQNAYANSAYTANPKSEYDRLVAEGMPLTQASPDTTTTETVQPSPIKATIDFWSKRDPEKAQKIADGVLEYAKGVALSTNDHAGAVNIINQSLGMDLKYVGSKGDIMTIANGDGTHILYNVATGAKQEIGTPKPMELKQGSVLVNPSTGAPIAQGNAKQGKVIDKTVDLGDKVFIQYADGTTEERAKGANPSTVLKVNVGDKTDQLVAREAVKELPKLRRDANTAVGAKSRIGQMLPMIENGVAGGLKGNILSRVSSIFDTPATSEADLFKKMATAGAGSMRMSVVGPGPVSNYENQLMQSISGGGNGARSAIVKLLKFYQSEADRTINDYNDAIETASTVAPKAATAFRKIGSGTSQPQQGGKKPLGAY